MSDIDLDLDALAPKAGKITYKGATLDLDPPLMQDLFEGASIIDKLNASEDIPGIEKHYKELEKFFKRVIPQITEQLSIHQYKKLYEKLQELAVPPDTRALEEAGISLAGDGDTKKDEPNTLEK